MAPSAVLTIPNGVTLLRLALTGTCWWLLSRQQLSLALIFFTIAWALDIVDGAIARRFNQATPVGFILDKAVDRTLLIGTAVFLISYGYLPPLALLLFVKDIASLPAMVIELKHQHWISDLGLAGKIFSVLQGLALLWLVLVGTYTLIIVVPLALAGGVIGFRYINRVVRA